MSITPSDKISFFWKPPNEKQWHGIPLSEFTGHTVEEVLLMLDTSESKLNSVIKIESDGDTLVLCGKESDIPGYQGRGYKAESIRNGIGLVSKETLALTVTDIMPDRMLQDVMAVFPTAELSEIGG